MKKTILILAFIMTLSISANAQFMAFGGGQNSLHSSWHAFVGAGSGYMLNFRNGDGEPSTTLNFQGGAEYLFDSGLSLGATAGLLHVCQSSKDKDDYDEFRALANAGWTFPVGKNSLFAKAGVGLGFINLKFLGDTNRSVTSFSYDVALGYRFTITDYLGIQLSTGIAGTTDWWCMIPITLSFYF